MRSIEYMTVLLPISQATEIAAMKTTIDISDALLREARKVAARHGMMLRALVEQGLRQGSRRKGASRPLPPAQGKFQRARAAAGTARCDVGRRSGTHL